MCAHYNLICSAVLQRQIGAETFGVSNFGQEEIKFRNFEENFSFGMLGRIRLNLTTDQVQQEERYEQPGFGVAAKPEVEKLQQNNRFQFSIRKIIFEMQTFNCFQISEPSTTICNGSTCLILVSAQHFRKQAAPFERLLISAYWGFVPRWHKGDYHDHGFNTVNFGVEHMEGSRMYEPPFNRGKRCVMLCEGYYEWQRIPKSLEPEARPVFFIHAKQPSRLIHIAGVFDAWKDRDGNLFYSFTMLSMPSDGTSLSWLHPRIPVILETEEQIAGWLNFEEVSSGEALAMIRRPTSLEWHCVQSNI